MINHARTLLLNAPPLAEGLEWPAGEEYVPRSFAPRVWPGYLNQIRRVLFGASPDRHMLNYRGGQLLAILESTPVAEWVHHWDPRVTYKTGEFDWISKDYFSPAVTSGSEELLWLGEPSPPDIHGAIETLGSIEIDGDQIIVRQQRPTIDEQSYLLQMEEGLSLPAPFMGTGYQFRTRGVSGSTWQVRIWNRPQRDMTELLRDIRGLGESTHLHLFGSETEEPWPTFRNLFYLHDEFPYQMSAVIAAVIHRANAIGA